MRKIEIKYPEMVLEKLYELRSKSKDKITISRTKGKYRIYKYKNKFDKKLNKKRIFTFYIGQIEEDGTFNKAVHSKNNTKVNTLSEHISAIENPNFDEDRALRPSTINIEILTELSMNSRISIPELSQVLNIKASSLMYRIKKLTNIYGIKKTIEVYPEKFGFIRYIVIVKNLKEKPNREKLKELISKEPRIQFAALMYGDYDLFLYIIAENVAKIEDLIYSLRSNRVFIDCLSEWNIGYILEGYGFIPLREEFFELIKDRIWKRSKDSPRRTLDQLLPSEYAVLKELNKDAGTSFSSIDTKYHLREGNSHYTYGRLLERKLIERSTIRMENCHAKYPALICAQQLDINAFNSKLVNFLSMEIRETGKPTNKYAFIGDISAPNSILFIAPVYTSIESIVEEIEKSSSGLRVSSAVITDILVGYVGFRRFDNLNSSQAKELENKNKELNKKI